MLENSWTSVTPLDMISQTSFFTGLATDQLQRINAIARFQSFGNGQQIYSIGDPAKNFYVLVDGMVNFAIGRGSRNASGGKILERGQVFGWAALTPTARLRVATASCLSDSTVLELDGCRLIALMEADNAMGYCIMKQLTVLITGTFTEFVAG